MRYLFILTLIFVSFPALAEETPGLNAFAEQYWSAIKSRDVEKIFALYDPAVLGQLTPEESEFMKKYWMESYSRTADKEGDSYEITSKTLPADSNPLPEWRWSSKPQYQITIQTLKNVPQGKEGLTTLFDMAIERNGRFYIVRGVPPSDELQAQIKKQKS